MNRTRKLYERLDQIEDHYASLLRAELEAVLDGAPGDYLGRKLRSDWDQMMGRRPSDARAVALGELETEIRRLRKKLSEPIPGNVVGIVEALIAHIKDAGEWSPGSNRSWLRNAITELTGST